MVVPVMLLAALPHARQRGAAKAENEGTRDRDESVESRRTPRAPRSRGFGRGSPPRCRVPVRSRQESRVECPGAARASRALR